MAQKPLRLWRPLLQAAVIVSCLLLWSMYLAFAWIITLPPLVQLLFGMAVGFTSVASYSHTQTHRSNYRMRNSMNLAQMSSADILSLQKLVPNNEKISSWLPGPSDAELVRWINVGLQKIWPFFKEASSGLIKVELEAVYNKFKADAIEKIAIRKIDLGDCCPYVEGLMVAPANEDNKCCLNVQLDWRQNENQEILLHVSTIECEFVVEVKNFVVYCVMQLTFVPLVQQLPGFAAIVVSIIEPPLIDFQTKFISGDVKKAPEMAKAVDNILLSAMMDTLVWPRRVVIPVLPGDYSDLQASCVGQLHVHLIEARDLANRHITGRSDPYVVLFLRRRNDLIKQSTRVRDTADPVWNEQFFFNVEDLQVENLTIKLMNAAEASVDVFVGTAEIAINQLKPNVREELWVELIGDPEKLHGRRAGQIHLLVEFKPKFQKVDRNDPGSQVDRETALSDFLVDKPASNLMPQESEKQDSDGLGVILEGDRRGSTCNRFGVVACGSGLSPTEASLSAELISLIADNQEPSGNNQTLLCPEKGIQQVDDSDLQVANEEAVAVQHLQSFESDSCPQAPTVGEESGSAVVICQNHEGTDCISSPPTDRLDVLIREGDHQPDFLAMGDLAWGLSGFSLEHGTTPAILDDTFSSELFELD